MSSSESSGEEHEHVDKEHKKKKRKYANIGSAIEDILNQEVGENTTPILARSTVTKITERKLKQEKRRERKDRQEKKQKKLLANKDYRVPDHSNAELEHKLKKLATRGVVQLFNTISSQQKLLSQDEEPKPKDDTKLTSLTKDKFLELLHKNAKIEP